MDNASKALIMAGAILISIAIVGVGVYIFSSTSSITDTGSAQMDAAAMALANSTIRQYEGNNIRGSQIKELVDYVSVLNKNGVYPDVITFTGSVVAGTGETEAISTASVQNSSTYIVAVTTNPSTGYIHEISVTKR